MAVALAEEATEWHADAGVGGEPQRAAELDVERRLDARELARARSELELKTELAREEQVTGVPTFMLGAWPFGGIQSEDTMGFRGRDPETAANAYFGFRVARDL